MASYDGTGKRMNIQSYVYRGNKMEITIDPDFNPIWVVNEIVRRFHEDYQISTNSDAKILKFEVKEPQEMEHLKEYVKQLRRNQNKEEEGHRICVRVPVRQSIEEAILIFRKFGKLEAARTIYTGLSKRNQPLYLLALRFQHKQHAREALEEHQGTEYGARMDKPRNIKSINGQERMCCQTCLLELWANDMRDHGCVCEGDGPPPMTKAQEIDLHLRSQYHHSSPTAEPTPRKDEDNDSDTSEAGSFQSCLDEYDQATIEYYERKEGDYYELLEKLKL